MSNESIAERVRTVYGKDLYDDSFNLNIRIDSDDLEHGDMLRVTVEKLQKTDDRDTEDESDESLQEE